jgi:CheY-like chemotaxis protein
MIVTDDPMPGLSGVRLAQQVHGRSPDPPVVPVTGSVEGFDAEALRSHGTAIRVLFR